MGFGRQAEGICCNAYFGPKVGWYMIGASSDGLFERADHLPDMPPAMMPDINETIVTAGLTDLQVNGFEGVDFNRRGIDAAALDKALTSLAACGVTQVLPTIISAEQDEMITLVGALDKAVGASQLGPFMVAGYHIEGPFLSPEDGYGGAHPKSAMVPANRDFIDRLRAVVSRPILIMTVAPERPGVMDLIPYLTQCGIACALGHTSASLAQIEEAIGEGARISTHLGNGLPHQLHKFDNPMLGQLAQDDLVAGFVADGIHVPPKILLTMLRAKTFDRSIVVSDAVAAAGLYTQPGDYTLGAQTVRLSQDGIVRTPGSVYLAGSSVRMDQIVRNLQDWFDLSLDEILMLACTNPAKAIGLGNGMPKIGDPVRLVHWRQGADGLQVRKTQIGPWIIENETTTKRQTDLNPRR